MAGCVAAVFAVFTIGSYLHYAAAATGYWHAVTKAACKCESYSEFVTLWRQRQQRGIGVDRKLPWWLPWLALTGILLAAYFGLTWFLKE